MSTAEVIEAVEEDRAYLSAYLKAKQLSESPPFVEECIKRLKEMQSSRRLDASSIRELHNSLEDKGL